MLIHKSYARDTWSTINEKGEGKIMPMQMNNILCLALSYFIFIIHGEVITEQYFMCVCTNHSYLDP